MSKIAPYTFIQELDDNGDPLSGGTIDTFEAGTTTPKQTFTDSTESTANANPVVLDAFGRADIWLDTGSYKFVLKDSTGSAIKTVDNITGDTVNVFGSEVTAISTNTNVTVSDKNKVFDCSAVLTLSLLAAATAGEGFIVGIKNRSAGAVTINPDGLELIDGQSTFTLKTGQSVMVICTGTEWLSLYVNDITPDDNTFTGDNTFSGDTTFTGDAAMSASQLKLVKGADIISAAALPLVSDGNYFDVTGTNAITSIDTTSVVGSIIKLHFDDILTLTYNATNLILPSGANITTAAGDEAEFVEYASGDWICTNYSKANGTPVVNTGLVLLSTASASTSATVEFNSNIDGTYDEYQIIITGLTVSSSGTVLQTRFSSDGGTSYDSGASDYAYQYTRLDTGNTLNTGDSSIEICTGIGTDVGTSCNAVIYLNNPSGSGYTSLSQRYNHQDSSGGAGVYRHGSGGGSRRAATVIDAIEFSATTGNIVTGEFRLYGVEK